ncbi:MAG: hypothetical protein WD875_14980 [Pirellulales bacterium]
MSQYGLIKSFGIDNGELDSLGAHECFVLGYELAQIDHLIATGEPAKQPVHADNRERIATACRDASREFILAWMEGDPSESWMMLTLFPRATRSERDLCDGEDD